MWRVTKSNLLVAAIAALGILVGSVLFLDGERPPFPVDEPHSAGEVDSEARARIEGLESELRRLKQDLDLRLATRRPEDTDREVGARAQPAVSAEIADRDPRWYLDRYTASFQSGGNGSEYFRLAVDAYAVELVGPITEIVADGARPVALRTSLAVMLGTPRFRGSGAVVGSLIGLVKREDEIAVACVRALIVVGDADVGRSLESFACWVKSRDLRRSVFTAAVALAGPDFDRAVLRLLACASDEEETRQLLALARGNDADALLELFRTASTLERETRLPAAQRIADFRTDGVRELARQWHSSEPDEEIRRHLVRAIEKHGEKAPWGAEQAVGPPDADVARDDPRSWASKDPDGGAEWLELVYALPLRARGVRVIEALRGGAIAEVLVHEAGGEWRSAWSGVQADSTPGECWIAFSATTRPIDRVRLVLDTRRTQGWNEIDAVELVGSDVSAWASSATASSHYGR